MSDDGLGGAPISIPAVAKGRVRPFEPIDLVIVNDAVVRIAAIEGAFPWHHHDEDELFICWDGSFEIELEGREPVALHPGELFVVLKGTRHRPVARGTAHALMLERPDTKQYGN